MSEVMPKMGGGVEAGPCIDVRDVFHVIVALVDAGHEEDAALLMRLFKDPVINDRLSKIAEKFGVPGAMKAAEKFASEALQE